MSLLRRGHHIGPIVAVLLIASFLSVCCFSPVAYSSTTSLPFTLKVMTIEGAEGAKLSAHVYIPTGEVPEGGFPAIVFIHSWCMNQIEYETQMLKYASDGYIVLCYDCRGWNLSGGKIATAGPLEMQDINLIVDWLLANTPANPEKIGSTGISYGGGQSLLALQCEPRIKTVVAMSGWTDLIEALAPEDSPKWFWSAFLVGTANVLGRSDSCLMDWLISYLKDENTDKTKQDLAQRSPMTYLDSINSRSTVPPIFVVNGINEDLFTSRQIVRFYEKYSGPKKLILANGIHATSEMPGLLMFPSDIWDQTKDWFDYWLKGESTGIMDKPAVSVYQKWTNSQGEFSSWPIPGTQNMSFYLSKEKTKMKLTSAVASKQASSSIYNRLLSSVSSGIPAIAPLLYSYLSLGVIGLPPAIVNSSKTSVCYDSDTLKTPVTVMGTPTARLAVKPDKSKYQVNFM
ncbi:MAG: alpha/beta fold hydrolase, partial [Chitinophagales bacterium]